VGTEGWILRIHPVREKGDNEKGLRWKRTKIEFVNKVYFSMDETIQAFKCLSANQK
jgi:hypothetical protein